jgi:hypothetical protein
VWEGSAKVFRRSDQYIEAVSCWFTRFFHMIPAFAETSTRLPVGAPRASGAEDTGLKAVIGAVFAVFLAGAVARAYRISKARRILHQATVSG